MFLRALFFVILQGLIAVLLATYALGQVTTYSYDALGRVIVVATDTEDDRSYTYDSANNITQMEVTLNAGINYDPDCVDGNISISSSQSATSVNVVAAYCTDENPNDTLSLVSFVTPTNGTIVAISGNYLIISNIPFDITAITYTVSDNSGGSDVAVLYIQRDSPGGGLY